MVPLVETVEDEMSAFPWAGVPREVAADRAWRAANDRKAAYWSGFDLGRADWSASWSGFDDVVETAEEEAASIVRKVWGWLGLAHQ